MGILSTRIRYTSSLDPSLGPMTSTVDTHANLTILEDWASIEPPMESDEHRDQLDLLIACLRWWWRNRSDVYISGNTTIFYDPNQKITGSSKGPDFYVVQGVDPRPRRSWMVWKENFKYPDLIIELLSDSTSGKDRNSKKEVYQTCFQTPEYYLFHPQTLKFEGYRLEGGVYQTIPTTEKGWRWSEQLQLYLGIHQQQLRYFTPERELILTDRERAEYEQQQRQREQQHAEQRIQQEQQLRQQAEQRLHQTALNLLQAGLSPDQVSAFTGLTVEQIQQLLSPD